MKKIKGTDINNVEFSGDWNEKLYTSKKEKEYYRIYVDNQEYHITENEREKIMGQIQDQKYQRMNAKIFNITEEIGKLNEEERMIMIDKIMFSFFNFGDELMFERYDRERSELMTEEQLEHEEKKLGLMVDQLKVIKQMYEDRKRIMKSTREWKELQRKEKGE